MKGFVIAIILLLSFTFGQRLDIMKNYRYIIDCLRNSGTAFECISETIEHLRPNETQKQEIISGMRIVCQIQNTSTCRNVLSAVINLLKPKNNRPRTLVSSKDAMVRAALELQDAFCKDRKPFEMPEIERNIDLSYVYYQGYSFTLYAFIKGDIVSDIVRKNHLWEPEESIQAVYAIDRYMSLKNIKNRNEVTFLDVGAQIGWFTMLIGSRGYKVVLFEPMKENEYILRRSLCNNQNVNALFINKALGKIEQNCSLYSENANIADPSLYCDTIPSSPTMVFRGRVETYKLDDFADYLTNVGLIKMDIEGFEYLALEGGKKVIIDMKVPFILSEFGVFMILDKGGNPLAYLKAFTDAGYRISTSTFTGPFLTEAQLSSLATFPIIVNLYMTHKSVG